LRLLFVPVSGPRGMGEYARALALATAVEERWPDAQIHFALSRAAPYSATTPFPSTLLPASPTFHSPEVLQLIREFRPTIVIFDNAGRSAQIRAAAQSGARVIFISSRKRQRRRAFRMRWMRLLDEHWIAWPQFMAGGPGPFESLKLRLLKRPVVRFLDTLLPHENTRVTRKMLLRFGVRAGEYTLVVPGGGSDHPGAEDAPAIVAEAARRIAMHGCATILVGVTPAADAAKTEMLRVAPRMPMSELAALIRNAKLVISNGGDTLLQALSCHRACVAVPIAGDQAFRIAECVRSGFAVQASLDATDMAGKAVALLEDAGRREQLELRLANAGIRNGLDTALEAVHHLSQSPPPPRSARSASTA
jgi:ADP-heptose:LPS heptosyltransferase